MDGASRNIGCNECMDLLADYVDGLLPREQALSLQWHIEGCPPCVAFVNTYKGTVNAAKRLRETALPPEVRERLMSFLQRTRS